MLKKKEASANVTQPAAPAPKMFGKFGATPARSSGNWIAAGTYVVELEECTAKLSQNQKTRGHELFIASFTILAVVAGFEADGDFKASNRAGERVSFIQNTSDPAKADLALANIKNLFLALGRLDDPDLNEQDVPEDEWNRVLAEAVAPPGRSLAGKRLLMYGIRRITKEGRPFVAVSFDPYTEPAAEAAGDTT